MHMRGRCDIISSVLKVDAKYSDVCMTRQTPSTAVFLVCGGVCPDDGDDGGGGGRHRNMSEYSLTV